MKVLIIFHAGALENIRPVYKSLVNTGCVELAVIVPQRIIMDRSYSPDGWLCVEHEEDSDGYHLIPVPLRNPYNYGRGFEVGRLQSVIKRIRPDVIHVVDEPTSNYLFQVVWQRQVASSHSKVLFYGFQNLPIRLGWRSIPWKLAWARMAGGVVANSEALENLKHAGFPQYLPLKRIFWGIPTDIFKPMNCLALKEELGLDCEYIVGFVGRFAPEKGLKVLQNAVFHLPANVHCLIIGSGPMRAELEQWSVLPGLNGRIHLYDSMPPETLAKYMNCMDVLVVPSLTLERWKEQYGRVIAEGMACGVPVVGSDSGAIPEVIDSAGLIVPEGNQEALAEAVFKVISDREVNKSFRHRGLQRVEQELGVKAMAERLLDFYRRV